MDDEKTRLRTQERLVSLRKKVELEEEIDSPRSDFKFKQHFDAIETHYIEKSGQEER